MEPDFAEDEDDFEENTLAGAAQDFDDEGDEAMTSEGFQHLFKNQVQTESAPVHQTYYALLNVSPTVPCFFRFQKERY